MSTIIVTMRRGSKGMARSLAQFLRAIHPEMLQNGAARGGRARQLDTWLKGRVFNNAHSCSSSRERGTTGQRPQRLPLL